MIAHWDDVPVVRREEGHIRGDWQSLTGDESVTIGVKRIRVPAGSWSTPLHLEGSEEEIFFVLAGTGVSVQRIGDEEHTFPVGPGDCLVHLALVHAHTLQAGPDGLDVLAFGQRHYARNTLLPRAGVSWLGPTWVLQGEPADHPWKREAAVGPPEIGEAGERPPHVVNVSEVEPTTRLGATVERSVRNLGRAAGSFATGLCLFEVAAGKLHNPPHCHNAEEEIFVITAGTGTLGLWRGARADGPDEEHAVRAGSVVARPAGTRVAHAFRAEDGGLEFLAYGTRDPRDVTYYPRSRKVSLRGLGVIGRLDLLDYWDGED
ncbi:MAG TPA: cupin domain-containing protein [Gaiella sp.]|nr:cupin domain-containing protein [Gaiella sp.]